MAAKPQKVPGPNQENTHFAARLQKWRASRGLFLKQVSAEFGVSEATWSRWEKEQRFPSPGNLRLLAEFIGVPVCSFYYADDGPYPNCPGGCKAMEKS